MVAILLDTINYNKVSKYANVLIFKEFYPKTKNVSYYLKNAVFKVMDTWIPKQTVKKKADVPWMTKDIKRMIHKNVVDVDVDIGLTSHSAIFQLYSDGTDVQFPNFDLLPDTHVMGS